MFSRLSKLSLATWTRLTSWPTWLWVVIAITLTLALYSWSVSSCGPWDPWETHYGEVARKMASRGEVLEMWWTPGRWGPDRRLESIFASKHVLPFWAMALSFWVFGVGDSRDPSEMVTHPLAEWALRAPGMLVGILTIAVLASVAARLAGRRAGWMTGLVLATLPLFFLVTRQALTDIYLVGPVTLALCAWALAWFDGGFDEGFDGRGDRLLQRKSFGKISLPNDRAYWAFFLTLLVATLLPLFALYGYSVSEHTLARIDAFVDKPGVPNLDTLSRVRSTLHLYLGLAFVCVFLSLRWTSRRQALLGIVYVAAGLSAMGKGILGPAIIGAVIAVDLTVQGRLKDLRRAGLVSGILLFMLTCFPWHHSMAIFRGEKWIRELLIDNNLARFASGEQEQAVGSMWFYLRTLLVSAFPWSIYLPMAAGGALAWFRRVDGDTATPKSASLQSFRRFAVLWFVVSFATITYSVTKYHHYLLLTLPPLALILGLWLAPSPAKSGRTPKTSLPCVIAALCILLAFAWEISNTPAWFAHVTTVYYTGIWRNGAPEPIALIWLTVPIGVSLIVWARWKRRTAIAVLGLCAVLSTNYLLNSYLPKASEHWSQKPFFEQYFEQRAPNDRLVSWWLYHRGETYFSKGRLWLSAYPNAEALQEYIETSKAENRNLWILTSLEGEAQLKLAIPRRLRANLHQARRSAHQVMFQLELSAEN